MDVCFLYYRYRVDLGFDNVSKRRIIINPCYKEKLSISKVASVYNVSPDCVIRSMPKLFIYDYYNEYLL